MRNESRSTKDVKRACRIIKINALTSIDGEAQKGECTRV